VITIQTIRAAIAAADPYSEMDRVVRAELTAGRLVKDVFEDIRPHVQDVLDTPSLSEDGEEAFLGTLDALAGFCRADQVYRNPPVLPTEDEIGQLPRWARVAFAARCARRVLPFARTASTSVSQLIEGAVERVEKVTRGVDLPNPHLFTRLRGDERSLLGTVADATVSAVISSAKASIVAALGEGGTELLAASFAVAAFESGDLRPHIRRDFDLLLRLASAYGWTDDTPVPPEVFGPLWPEGKPAGWPDDPESPKRNDFALEAVSSERVTHTMIEDEVVNLFLAMNRFHIARTGQSLTVEDFQPYIAALVPAGV